LVIQNPGEILMAVERIQVTRRKFVGVGSAALAASAALAVAKAQESEAPKPQQPPGDPVPRSRDHHSPNEQDPGPNNAALDEENPSTVWSSDTDNGAVPPFKYSFSLGRKRIESGGWTRQVTARELPISKTIAGVEMRLTA
jgi:oxalate decarboxylase